MDQLGARLKAAREARGHSLRDIAATTKISVAALEAVERNDYSRLPAGIFGRAFIRAYALEVGLDPEATVRDFMTEVEAYENSRAKKIRPPEITAEDRAFVERQRQAARLLRLAVVVLIVGIASFVIWRARPLWSGGAAPAPVEAHAATPAKVDYRPPPPSTPFGTPAAGTAAASSGAVTTPTPAPAAQDQLKVGFDVTADCWVQVTADGLVVLGRVMKAGEHQQFTADHEIGLDVGNAGAFHWSINGKSAKPLGKDGAHKQARVTLASVADFVQ
jgi:cytoskeletal protein RodZ